MAERRARTRDQRWPLLLGGAVSLLAHAGLLAGLTTRSEADAAQDDRAVDPDEATQEPEQKAKFGLERSRAVSINWLGFEDNPSEHLSPEEAETEQSAFTLDMADGEGTGDPKPADMPAPPSAQQTAAAGAQPTPPVTEQTPQSQQTPEPEPSRADRPTTPGGAEPAEDATRARPDSVETGRPSRAPGREGEIVSPTTEEGPGPTPAGFVLDLPPRPAVPAPEEPEPDHGEPAERAPDAAESEQTQGPEPEGEPEPPRPEAEGREEPSPSDDPATPSEADAPAPASTPVPKIPEVATRLDKPSVEPERTEAQAERTTEASPAATARTGKDGPARRRPGQPADRESLATALEAAGEVKLGRVLAGEGLEIKTVSPEWPASVRATASPKDPVVEIDFKADGTVAEAGFLRGRDDRDRLVVYDTGLRSVDEPLLDAVYRWRASGEQLRELPAGELLRVTVRVRLR